MFFRTVGKSGCWLSLIRLERAIALADRGSCQHGTLRGLLKRWEGGSLGISKEKGKVLFQRGPPLSKLGSYQLRRD